jgi:hypothetical protein
LSDIVDKMVKRTSDAWEQRIGAIAKTALTLDEPIALRADEAVKHIAKAETVRRKEVAIIVDEKSACRTR